jgi:hypothetical protein
LSSTRRSNDIDAGIVRICGRSEEVGRGGGQGRSRGAENPPFVEASRNSCRHHDAVIPLVRASHEWLRTSL